jgi:peptidoglycan/xylan/chitin deacetylase (PgdA/CDA1 family)
VIEAGFKSRLLTKAVFVISLDLELAVGFALNPERIGLNSEREYLALLQSNPQQTRARIDLLLKLFGKYDIKATWAVVGHLFLRPGEERCLAYREMPQFKEGWLNRDLYQGLSISPLLLYGREIVENILANPLKHEIGLHGFYHIPFDRCSREVAEAEIELGVRAASKLGVTPTSFVFPANKQGHIDLLKKNGIRIYRGETLGGRQRESQNLVVRKLNGAIDKLLVAPVFPSRNTDVWQIPGSIFFCDTQLPFTLPWRARLGLYQAIRTNSVFHIWLHPWNLLLYKRLAKDLEEFLALVAEERDKDNIQVMTMAELASEMEGKDKLAGLRD